jgi:hypothetical protein
VLRDTLAELQEKCSVDQVGGWVGGWIRVGVRWGGDHVLRIALWVGG